jgi:hypothetical protein
MKVPKSQLQPPFRQQDLLDVSSFISYCADRGITTSERQLEYYEKKNLLLPAMRVYPGYVAYRRVQVRVDNKWRWQFCFPKDVKKLECKRIDRRTYYADGTFLMGEKSWLDRCKKNGMVLYPSQCRFRKWKYYRGPRPRRHRYSARIPPVKYEAFYSRYQVFPLKLIQRGLTIRFVDEALFADDETWLGFGKQTRLLFSKVPRAVRKTVLRCYSTIHLLQDILDLRNELFSAALETYESVIEGNKETCTEREARSEALLEARETLRYGEQETAPYRASSIQKKRGLSVKQIHERRREFLNLAIMFDPIRSLFQYLDHIPEGYLESCRGDYRFARDCYKVVDQLGWFFNSLGQEVASVEKMMTGTDKFRICIICKKPFEPDRRTRVTCGNKRCKREYNNIFKREMRRKGYID